MSILSSIFLGVLQGLTEFLPVSSSGHLVIAQSLIPEFVQPGVFFDVVLHAGTLFSILIYFRKKIVRLSSGYLYLIIIGTIPAVIAGILFQSFFESLFTLRKVVAVALLFTAFLNIFTDRGKEITKKITSRDSLFIGFFQALAIIPGISRSGSTIFAGSVRGIEKKKVAEFSFLLSVPAVAGASFIQFVGYGESLFLSTNYYLAGFVSALISGYVAISLVYRFLLKRRFKVFGVYCLIVGIFSLIF